MSALHDALILLLLVTGLSVLGRRLPWPLPITYVVGAGLMALWPAFPRVELDPGFFFLCFVPPLLFADGWLMPLRDFAAARRPILLLATGLVVFTTLAVGWVAHALVPTLPLPLAFALGAVVSPTDAVAVNAITQRLKVPARLTAILNGESLMNDATGLVAFKFSVAAFVAGTFSLRAASWDFLMVALGGLGIGAGLAVAIGWVRDFLRQHHGPDARLEVTLSLLTPYAAYLSAEGLHLSGILAVVAAGLYSGWRDPLRMDVGARQTAWAVWSTILYWLNGLAFILLGLQLPAVLQTIAVTRSWPGLLLLAGAVSATAIVTRLVWVYPGAYLPPLLLPAERRSGPLPSWQGVLVAGWAGMRGTVTLAAALSLPRLLPDGSPLPERDLIIFLAAAVIVVTLLLQGTTLETLIERLQVRADDTAIREEHLARRTAVEAGLVVLQARPPTVPASPSATALGEVIAEYEHRLAELAAAGESRECARQRNLAAREYRLAALRAERQALDDLWRKDIISDETHRPLQQLLDYEEAMLDPQSRSSD